MKSLCSLTLLCLFGTVVQTHGATWLTDYGAAKLRVAAENKPMLIFFTGSDWCPPCKRVTREVFDRPEFKAYADANLILLKADFPRRQRLPLAQQQSNQALAKSMKVRYYPTIILMDTKNREVARLRYTGKGSRPFISMLHNQILKSRSPGSGQRTRRPSSSPKLFGGATTAPPRQYADLQLKSITGPTDRKLALINNQTLAAGESARVKLGDDGVRLHCLEIRKDSVIVAVGNDPGERELKLAPR
jgi:thiol-disulfide isomerase/thioredoxin